MQFFLKDETLRQYKEFLSKSEEYKAQAREQAMVAAPLPPNCCPHDVSYKYDCATCNRENEIALAEESKV